MATTRAWVGGGNNRANNPNDWSLAGAPQPGDTLSISGGTINIVGGDLAGDNLRLNLGGPFPYTGPITVNLSQFAVLSEYLTPYTANTSVAFNVSNSTLNLVDGSPYFGTLVPTINLSGNDVFHLDVAAGSGAVVNLIPNTIWTGSIYAHALGNHDYAGNTVVFGSLNSSFHNQASEIDSGQTFINADVLGIGSFGMGLKDSYPGHAAKLEFAQSVGAGQTVTMSDPAHYANSGLVLQLDAPTAFHGSVTFNQGTINLAGLALADSYSFKNDILSIYFGNRIIDTLRLHDATAHGFAVEKVSAGISIVAITNPANPPINLPVHV